MKKIIALILIVLNGWVLFYLLQQVKGGSGEIPFLAPEYPDPEAVAQVRQAAPLPAYETEVPVRGPVALSGTPWQTVFELRKDAVAQSPFAQEDYRPLAAVYGQIVSGKPWYALTLCRLKSHALTEGPSEETRFINNPTALVAVVPDVIFINNLKYDWCTQDDYNTIMQKITFDGTRKEITVTYLDLPLQIQEKVHYTLNGLNARDLGYPFVYVDLERSSYKLSFVHTPNASTDVYEFRDFLHVGPSCSVPGGCNNGSPYQAELNFDKDTAPADKPREIYLKLWKERPSSPQEIPDLVERIIILPKGARLTE